MADRTLTYFLSDLHLGARYFNNPREAEQRVVRFLDSIKETAKSIYLLGDILDYWFEYRHVVPRGFIRFFGKLAELADSGITITWMIGNHDIWIFDYLPNELGIEVIDGNITREINGKRFFLSHGDGLGKMPLSFRFIRGMFRNRICQKLYSGIHPRWTIPFALGWSGNNRITKPLATPYKGADQEPLMLFANEHSKQHPEIVYYIFGHRHLAIQEKLPEGAVVTILGEWIESCTYALFDGENLTLTAFKE